MVYIRSKVHVTRTLRSGLELGLREYALLWTDTERHRKQTGPNKVTNPYPRGQYRYDRYTFVTVPTRHKDQSEWSPNSQGNRTLKVETLPLDPTVC